MWFFWKFPSGIMFSSTAGARVYWKYLEKRLFLEIIIWKCICIPTWINIPISKLFLSVALCLFHVLLVLLANVLWVRKQKCHRSRRPDTDLLLCGQWCEGFKLLHYAASSSLEEGDKTLLLTAKLRPSIPQDFVIWLLDQLNPKCFDRNLILSGVFPWWGVFLISASRCECSLHKQVLSPNYNLSVRMRSVIPRKRKKERVGSLNWF